MTTPANIFVFSLFMIRDGFLFGINLRPVLIVVFCGCQLGAKLVSFCHPTALLNFHINISAKSYITRYSQLDTFASNHHPNTINMSLGP